MKFKKIIFGVFVVFLIPFGSSFAQSFNVSGTVSDKNNFPLVGANVIIKELSIGTATDNEGKFIILNLKNFDDWLPKIYS